MYLTKWSRDCESGNDQIDRQHKQLSALAREALATFGSGASGVPPLSFHLGINKIEALFRKHYVAEERILGRNLYPWLAEHREQHAELSAQLSDLVVRAMLLELDRGHLNRVMARLMSHLGSSDLQCRDFLSVETPWTVRV